MIGITFAAYATAYRTDGPGLDDTSMQVLFALFGALISAVSSWLAHPNPRGRVVGVGLTVALAGSLLVIVGFILNDAIRDDAPPVGEHSSLFAAAVGGCIGALTAYVGLRGMDRPEKPPIEEERKP